ncbi:hypothetical protein [Nitrincola tapanii]|uniref:Uncharacterized protein n=1 Tax=Nitrincola tapanii TaxID=1708751 RepID=A0A5A9W0D7_9GAMM|nr:hypothetical protein [Nitrincola tapanii]KAA0874207.1 hypothetical protein E1H14_10570 [Nitrincola tapanii]
MNKRLLLSLLISILLVVLAGIGYGVFIFVEKEYEKSSVDLEKFGFGITGAPRIDESSVGILGQAQLPATFVDQKLTPAERVIQSLVRDRDNLMLANQSLQQQISALEKQIADLEHQQKLNEHFVPETFEQELDRVENMLHLYLQQSTDAQRFSRVRIELMAAAGRMEYKRFVEANRLMLDSAQRTRIVLEHLPAFMFCVGDAVQLAANSVREERSIQEYFYYPDQVRLANALQQDLNSVLPACQRPLRENLQSSLSR